MIDYLLVFKSRIDYINYIIYSYVFEIYDR